MNKPAALATLAALPGIELARRLYRDSRLFAPEREPVLSWDPAAHGLDPALVDEITMELDGNELYGWYCRAAAPVASILYCHGNRGNLTLDLPAIRDLARSGVSVLTFDYRGYGRSSGRPGLRGVVRDALAAARIHDQLRPASLPSLLYGFSLGGAIAARIAGRTPFDALFLQSTFTCLREITRALYPSVPLHLLCAGELDTVAALRTLELPTVVIHGVEDEVVPVAMAETLFESAAQPRELLKIEGGMHGDLFDVASDRIVALVRRVAVEVGSGASESIAS